MSRASFITPTLAIAAVCALGACRNGPKNYRDSTGYNENSAAGQVQPAPGTGATGGATVDSTGTGTAATTGAGVAGSALPGAMTPDTTAMDSTAMDSTMSDTAKKAHKASKKKR